MTPRWREKGRGSQDRHLTRPRRVCRRCARPGRGSDGPEPVDRARLGVRQPDRPRCLRGRAGERDALHDRLRPPPRRDGRAGRCQGSGPLGSRQVGGHPPLRQLQPHRLRAGVQLLDAASQVPPRPLLASRREPRLGNRGTTTACARSSAPGSTRPSTGRTSSAATPRSASASGSATWVAIGKSTSGPSTSAPIAARRRGRPVPASASPPRSPWRRRPRRKDPRDRR